VILLKSARELGHMNIRVNAIAPGATATPRTVADAGWEDGWAAAIPMRRVAQGADVAGAALFLLSDEAAHVTGQSLVIDGGWTARGAVPDGRSGVSTENRRRDSRGSVMPVCLSGVLREARR